jgi:glycosyltransferase involved in cell wall biosynthesis
VEKKGTIYLLRALAQLRERHPDARLAIVGEGPLRPTLEAEAKSLGIADRVTFLGRRPNTEVLDIVRSAALMAVPSVVASNGDAEGLPIVNMEASALGVPVVGFDSAGISEAVEHGKTGFLAPERDVAGLARHVDTLLGNEELRRTMGQAARALAVREFDQTRQTEKLEDIYDDVLRDRVS